MYIIYVNKINVYLFFLKKKNEINESYLLKIKIYRWLYYIWIYIYFDKIYKNIKFWISLSNVYKYNIEYNIFFGSVNFFF